MQRSALALLLLLAPGCAQSLAIFGERDAGASALPAQRGEAEDAGPAVGADAGPADADAGPADAGPGDPDAGPPAACVTWQDCPPHLGDPYSGYACVEQQCTCDPDGQIAQGCGQAGGFWRPEDCYCEVLEEEPAACEQWQDCPPHYGSEQSGYECVEQQCACDPTGEYEQTCAGLGGYWVAAECFCAFADEGPPGYAPEPDCWWHLEEPPCDPDEWVDTSGYEEECYYDADDELVCHDVWVDSGYWRPGACPSPYWEQRCYG